jgi:DNA-damage-inducible protein D
MSQPTTQLTTVFHFEDGHPNFENLGKPNGIRLWAEADLMQALGYEDNKSFRKAITRAMQACLSSGIQMEENFILNPDGNYALTRFGCYLVAMNGDTKKAAVAAAQAYFATLAETFKRCIDHAENIDRLLVRDELTDGMKAMSSTAKSHGVENYAFFQNQGYRGMYNMNLANLIALKNCPGGQLLDRMGKEELAANLFRVTQTTAKIKNEGIRGQQKLETAAFTVGRKVRDTMINISGTAPEHLPLAAPIQEVKKALKGTNKKFKSLDKPKKKGTSSKPDGRKS